MSYQFSNDPTSFCQILYKDIIRAFRMGQRGCAIRRRSVAGLKFQRSSKYAIKLMSSCAETASDITYMGLSIGRNEDGVERT